MSEKPTAEKVDSDTPGEVHGVEFKRFAYKRIAIGILVSAIVLWALGAVLGLFDRTPAPATPRPAVSAADKGPAPSEETGAGHVPAVQKDIYRKAAASRPSPAPAAPAKEATSAHGAAVTVAAAGHGAAGAAPRGVAFVRSVIQPLEYELNKRFWGWRPNDILNVTDNVNNFQLGVLEVTRRTSMALAERLSRTGSTAVLDHNLERAMNWFMVSADRYWFPSPESKYKEGLQELRGYLAKLQKAEATFFTRPDNLIPLLATYEDLLGSCDENLVKAREEDGTTVSFFKADDYFYYAQGVATAMATILEAVLEDFGPTLEARHGSEVIEHAIESCHRATDIHPWIILEADLDSIFANHRANVAAPISHARFYMSVLIKALST